MPYVVTENCHKCRFTDCVKMCPVDAFFADDDMLYIHPDECIDCSACESICPVDAIYTDYDLPAHLSHWEDINAEKSRGPTVKQMFEPEDPHPMAEKRRAEIEAAKNA